ncbi:hypothetical protein OVA24_05790 [Luteolibacter sp. SL250]|uniref:hypothetical protein n=1 Tax=Luteolibacter sp. SL250 TaxID=2995170 RepID=UPI00226D97AB|nr:hypothetical protein [Luteolibacter sp. SL250]WAC20893.1 hypothetical protein OVA24_05790 [Luteolibacter sp. SL250]
MKPKALKPLPQQPFLTQAFADDGGGIDFLGLRLVNFDMLAGTLLPGVNNATTDIGIFCLGAWIAWKFQRICEGQPKKFSQQNYDRFRQAIEMAMADGVKDNSEANEKFGMPNRRIGVDQTLVFPTVLSFDKNKDEKKTKRTESTSIYAAALYGPALRYLDFIGYATAKDGHATWIHVPISNEETDRICEYIESRLSDDPLLVQFGRLDFEVRAHEDLENLQLQGLHPAAFRVAPQNVKQSLIRLLLGNVSNGLPNGRRITTRLIIDTLEQIGAADSEDLRRTWFTGLVKKNAPLVLTDPMLEHQRASWAIFEGRQFQRYILETFLRVFELAVREGCSSVDDVVNATLSWLGDTPLSLADGIRRECLAANAPSAIEAASNWWNSNISGDSNHYDWIDMGAGEAQDECPRAFGMLVRWILRTKIWLTRFADHEDLSWGGETRISIRWFHGWLEDRMNRPLNEFFRDLYADLVFTQHLRVALSRLDPGAPKQRLRFMLSDFGIVPTAGMENKIGENSAPWMADRLDAWLCLLTDVEVLTSDEKEKKYGRGRNVEWI